MTRRPEKTVKLEVWNRGVMGATYDRVTSHVGAPGSPLYMRVFKGLLFPVGGAVSAHVRGLVWDLLAREYEEV